MAYILHLNSNKSFLNFRLKTKNQIIDIWLDVALKLLSNMYKVKDLLPPCCGECVFLVELNDYWRLFILDKDYKKIVTITFPFQIEDSFQCVRLNYQDKEITEKDISMIKSILRYMFHNNPPLPIDDSIIEVLFEYEIQNEEIPIFLSNIIVYLLSFNDGYIRYDYDCKNVKGKSHPLCHLDIFFSNQSTFKIGLNKQYSVDDLIDLLDHNRDCKYLN